MNKTTAIILAGGLGKRMKTKVLKQFLPLAGIPVIVHAISKFENSRLVSNIVIVSHRSYIKRLEGLIKKNAFRKIYKIVPGGETRQESSFIGIKNCPAGTELVLIHDAARPFVSEKIIKNVLKAAKSCGAAEPAINVDDTIIETDGAFLKNIPERDNLKRVQTPQAFRYKTILKAHEDALKRKTAGLTDDAALVLAMELPVRVVEGEACNLKITGRLDMIMAEKILFDKHNLLV